MRAGGISSLLLPFRAVICDSHSLLPSVDILEIWVMGGASKLLMSYAPGFVTSEYTGDSIDMASLPLNFRKIVVSALSSNFREATKLVNVSMLQPREGELLIKNR